MSEDTRSITAGQYQTRYSSTTNTVTINSQWQDNPCMLVTTSVRYITFTNNTGTWTLSEGGNLSVDMDTIPVTMAPAGFDASIEDLPDEDF